MVFINEVIDKYEKGELTLEEANEQLKDSGFYINPNKNVIAEEEKAVYCEDVTKINGYALLDIGIGGKEKVMIKDGKLVDPIAKSREDGVKGIVVVQDILFYIHDGATLEKE